MGELKVYTLKEAADLLRTDNQTILDEVDAGNIDAFKIGKDWRITADSIIDFIAKGGSNYAGKPAAIKAVSKLDLHKIPAFPYTWPGGETEQYNEAYEGTYEDGKFHYEVKIGIGEREAAGKMRKRVTVFLNGRPTVEFAGADDFDKDGLLASVITLPNKKRLKPHQPIPKEYQWFDIRRYDSVVTGPRASTTMALVSRIDDLDTIVAHAVNRAIYRDEIEK